MGVNFIRTCVGCREKTFLKEMLRVSYYGSAGEENTVVPDRKRIIPSRGAWLHFRMSCYETALKQKAFHRSLKIPYNATIDNEKFFALLRNNES